MYHVRFHLGRGKNYLKWQIKNTQTGDVRYYSPDQYELVMTNCKLVNHIRIAQKIHDGANKEVCAWISCSSVIPLVNTNKKVDKENQITYNPRVSPCWMRKHNNENIDDFSFSYLYTKGRELFEVNNMSV